MAVATLKFLTGATSSSNVVNKVTVPKRVVLKQDGGSGITISFPFGPQDLKFRKLGQTYQEIRRPYLKPILVAESGQLRTVTFNALIADKNSGGSVSVQKTLDDLEIMSNEDVDCEFSYGLVALPFRVRITQLSVVASRRDVDGNIIQASVSVQLTEAVSVKQALVKLAAIAETPPPQKSSPSTRKSTSTTTTSDFNPEGCTSSNLSPTCDASRTITNTHTSGTYNGSWVYNPGTGH